MTGQREGRVLVGKAVAVLVSVHLLPDVQSVAVARDLVATTCASSGIASDVRDTATLLASELVTNAVVHAGTDVALHIRPDGQRLRIEVEDQDLSGRVVVLPPNPTARSGRGVQLVSVLAADWGVTPHVTGKTVWFELNIAEPSRDQQQVTNNK